MADTKIEFFRRVIDEIDFFKSVGHISKALVSRGYTIFSKEMEAEMFQVLKDIAEEEAGND